MIGAPPVVEVAVKVTVPVASDGVTVAVKSTVSVVLRLVLEATSEMPVLE